MNPGLGPGVEFDLIRRFLAPAPAARQGVRVGPGDDAAVVTGEGIVLSTDLSVEDVHFRRAWLTAREVGYRAAGAALRLTTVEPFTSVTRSASLAGSQP